MRECVGGSEEAWRALIFKYKNLIFSIPVKYGFSPEDSTDIFQAVCLDLLSELPKLEKSKRCRNGSCRLPRTNVFIANSSNNGRTCWIRGQGNRAQHAGGGRTILRETEDEQNLRQAMAELPPRCRELVQMLFYNEPVRPYQGIAAIWALRWVHRVHPAALPGAAAQASAGSGLRMKVKPRKKTEPLSAKLLGELATLSTEARRTRFIATIRDCWMTASCGN